MNKVSQIRHIQYTRIPKDGESPLMLVIDPPTITVETDADGKLTGNYPGRYTFKCYVRSGAVNEDGWSFTSEVTGCSCSLTQATGSGGILGIGNDINGTVSSGAKVEIYASKGGRTLTATLIVARAMKGSTGTAGAFVPPPRFWEEYPIGYQFMSGAPGESRNDCVYMRNEDGRVNSYRCVSSFQKSAASLSPDQDIYNATSRPSGHWVAAFDQAVDLYATQVLLANNAFIDLLGTNGIKIWSSRQFGSYLYNYVFGALSDLSGAYSFKDIPLIFWLNGATQGEGPIAGVHADPKFGIDENGKVYSGGLDGQHIEIDPIEKCMFVFDESGNVCATHSGRKIVLDDTVIKGTLKGITSASTFAISAQTVGNSTASQNSSNTITKNSPSRKALNDGKVTISIPRITINAYPGMGAGINGQIPYGSATCTLTVSIVIGGAVKHSYSKTATSGLNGTSSTQSTDAYEGTFDIKKDQSYFVKVSLQYNITSPKNVSSSGVSATMSGTGVTFLINYKVFNAEFGGNGMYFATDAQNFVYFIFDDDGALHAKCVANNRTVFDSGNN